VEITIFITNPCKRLFAGILAWVPNGTRTHDIQNHNPWCEMRQFPFIYKVLGVLLFVH
jgi:hypothetical protein